jgi:hypothetical protein
MVFDLGYTSTPFPLGSLVLGGALLWLGLNIRIIPVGEDNEVE